MSVLGSVYVLDDSQLTTATDLLNDGNQKAFWAIMQSPGVEVDPEFAKMNSSGYLLAVCISWLDEKGINLGVDNSDPRLESIAQNDGVITALMPNYCKSINRPLKDVPTDIPTLQRYYDDFSQTKTPNAGKVMADAIYLLQRAVHLASDGDKYLLVITF
jgi:hypothetical protein